LAPTKNGICIDSDSQLCYKTCGPNSIGFKSEICTAGVYVEQSGCSFPSDQDYSCYKIPTTVDTACPTDVPQASTVCTVATCTLCSVNGGYLDSSGAAKTGYCVCPGTLGHHGDVQVELRQLDRVAMPRWQGLLSVQPSRSRQA
jgi:hypothetical protein